LFVSVSLNLFCTARAFALAVYRIAVKKQVINRAKLINLSSKPIPCDSLITGKCVEFMIPGTFGRLPARGRQAGTLAAMQVRDYNDAFTQIYSFAPDCLP